MAATHSSVLIASALILSCCLLGGYATLFTSFNHGFFDALRVCTSLNPEKCPLELPQDRYIPSYTGIPAVDERIAVLLEFFARGVTRSAGAGAIDAEALLAVIYLAAQFGGLWGLIALEGLRKGHAGSFLSWTATFGVACQLITVNIAAPIYMIVQLFSSPDVIDQTLLEVDLLDLRLFPVSTATAFVLPTAGLALPLAFDLSPKAKYLAIALWQPFPVYQTVSHALARFLSRSRRSGSTAAWETGAQPLYARHLGWVYKFLLSLTLLPHLLVVGSILASCLAGKGTPLSIQQILAPDSLLNPPTLALTSQPVPMMVSRAIVVSFLKWDVYCACVSATVWASCTAYLAARDTPFLAIISKVVFWLLVGGPVAPAIMLLWARDLAFLDPMSKPKAKRD